MHLGALVQAYCYTCLLPPVTDTPIHPLLFPLPASCWPAPLFQSCNWLPSFPWHLPSPVLQHVWLSICPAILSHIINHSCPPGLCLTQYIFPASACKRGFFFDLPHFLTPIGVAAGFPPTPSSSLGGWSLRQSQQCKSQKFNNAP